MIRAVATLIYGIVVAVLILLVAVAASIWVIGMSAKAALFGDPKASLAMKVIQRAMKERKVNSTDITHITPENEETTQAPPPSFYRKD